MVIMKLRGWPPMRLFIHKDSVQVSTCGYWWSVRALRSSPASETALSPLTCKLRCRINGCEVVGLLAFIFRPIRVVALAHDNHLHRLFSSVQLFFLAAIVSMSWGFLKEEKKPHNKYLYHQTTIAETLSLCHDWPEI